MGVLFQTLLRLVDPNQLQKLLCPLLRLRLRLVCMEQHCLHDLVSDRIYRIQAGHGILENNRDFISADLPHLLICHLIHLMAVKIQASPDQLARISRQPHQAVCCYRFARTAFSNDSQHFSFS